LRLYRLRLWSSRWHSIGCTINSFSLSRANTNRPRAFSQSKARTSVRLRPHRLFVPHLLRSFGACIGAVATSFFLFDRLLYESTVLDKSAAARAAQPNSPISAQPKPVKSQSFPGEQKTQNNTLVTSSDNPDATQAEVQKQTVGQNSAEQPACNVSLCESYYQSFRASDCTYQPYSGPRQYCAR
jgi:BA14K-like protein